MNYALMVEDLQMLNKSSHQTGKDIDSLLPFTTHTFKELRKNFYKLTGDIVRNICQVKWRDVQVKDEFEVNPLIKSLKQEMRFEFELETEIERFLQDYLYGASGEIIITHPYLFNYSESPDKKEYRKISKFTAEILVGDNEEVRNIFLNKKTDNILDELVLDKLNLSFNSEDNDYTNKLPVISELYCDDLLYLSKHKDYFLNAFPMITRFYIFMYVCQLILKFDRFYEADYEKLTAIYFALDWEVGVGKRREATNELEGYKRIKDKAKYLFVHMNTLAQLNRFEANKYEGKYRFLHYKEILEQINELEIEKKTEYLASLQRWIQEYQTIFSTKVSEKDIPKTIEEAIKTLFKSNTEGIVEGAAKKFGDYIEDLGGNEFLKFRGKVGTTMNLTKEMLLMLAGVCIRDTRIPLNQLFEEFNKRGIKLDRISKKIVIELLDSLNFIDKKSDSGDAQYVKPIL
ncbi:DNA phosphorothioation-dependent restriction protein DptG [Paenibacillus hexagrammi]|uniref:DNA phosphorothioation-dependent restriction protein DptG n=1 Tax=Paenibacillus hexagrammi TaxID=2908839 RepID=A0ABY3SF87_9BACL|nr:DNA phosphorothioation-dependent restriction protein DptG [Paenibacillus sp. YPD9-1]UJF32663.1 DNA phosphorothioation-dependent restriction protein DptG [Paenibacillus sp. YPD9-1]